MAKKTSKLKKTILGIAIALILVFFLGYSVNTLYKEPKWENYCSDVSYRQAVDSCGNSTSTNGNYKGLRPMPIEGGDCFCNEVDNNGTVECTETNPEYTKCQGDYDSAREAHGRVSFIVLIILGLVSVLIGGVLLKVESVSSGIMGGGVLTLIYGTIRYWGSIPDYVRLVILGIALAVLIWIGYKKLKD